MIEKLVDLYYSDDWENFAEQGGNAILRKCFDALPSNIQSKLYGSWFHDAYLMRFECCCIDETHSVRLTLKKYIDRKRAEIIVLVFSFVTMVKCNGNFIDAEAHFPHADCEKPIAQLLDIWVEESDEFIICLLFDNARSLLIRCSKNEQSWFDMTHRLSATALS